MDSILSLFYREGRPSPSKTSVLLYSILEGITGLVKSLNAENFYFSKSLLVHCLRKDDTYAFSAHTA